MFLMPHTLEFPLFLTAFRIRSERNAEGSERLRKIKETY